MVSNPQEIVRLNMAGVAAPKDCSPASMMLKSFRKPRSSTDVYCTSAACPPPARKCLSFNKVVKVKKTLHLNNYSEEEIENCWYCQDDFDSNLREARVIAHLVESGLLEKDTREVCRRGVERYVDSIAKPRQNLQLRSLDMVFQEQELQWNEGFSDLDYLGQVYESIASKALSIARDVGRKDEKEARKILRKR